MKIDKSVVQELRNEISNYDHHEAIYEMVFAYLSSPEIDKDEMDEFLDTFKREDLTDGLCEDLEHRIFDGVSRAFNEWYKENFKDELQ